jgi:hypothetical protein
MFVRAKTPAPPEAKLTPLRNMEELELPVALKMERYAGGLATPRPAAAIDRGGKNCEISLFFI